MQGVDLIVGERGAIPVTRRRPRDRRFYGLSSTPDGTPGRSRCSGGDAQRGSGADSPTRYTPSVQAGFSIAGRSAHRSAIEVRPCRQLSLSAVRCGQAGRFETGVGCVLHLG